MEVEYLPCDDGDDDDVYDNNDDDCDHDHDGDEGIIDSDDVANIIIMMKFDYLSVKQTLLMPIE
jgi:hypothetical protein